MRADATLGGALSKDGCISLFMINPWLINLLADVTEEGWSADANMVFAILILQSRHLVPHAHCRVTRESRPISVQSFRADE